MDSYGIPYPDTRDPLERALDRIDLCAMVIQETHLELEQPADTEHRADLLLSVEALAAEALELLHTERIYAWGKDSDEDEEG